MTATTFNQIKHILKLNKTIYSCVPKPIPATTNDLMKCALTCPEKTYSLLQNKIIKGYNPSVQDYCVSMHNIPSNISLEIYSDFLISNSSNPQIKTALIESLTRDKKRIDDITRSEYNSKFLHNQEYDTDLWMAVIESCISTRTFKQAFNLINDLPDIDQEYHVLLIGFLLKYPDFVDLIFERVSRFKGELHPGIIEGMVKCRVDAGDWSGAAWFLKNCRDGEFSRYYHKLVENEVKKRVEYFS